MTVDWDAYHPFDPGVEGPAATLPRRDARRLFDALMAARGARLEMLSRLVATDGIQLSMDDLAVQRLNDWFVANLEMDESVPGRPAPRWFAVAHDVALFLGEVMISRHPHLRWEFFVWGQKNVSYHRHVIMGLATENPRFRTNIDIDLMVSGYAHRVLNARGTPLHLGIVNVRGATIDLDAVTAEFRAQPLETDAFVNWLRIAARRAGAANDAAGQAPLH